MNVSMIISGLFMMILGGVFSVVTFGFGLICSWPLVVIGFIVFVMGFLAPRESVRYVNMNRSSQNHAPKDDGPGRYCPNCGRAIPENARVCPYCGTKLL